MEVKITKYAITTKRTDLKLHRGLLNGMILDEKEKISIDAGTMIKVLSRGNSRYFTVQVLDYINHNPVWENIYDCPNSNLKKIHEDMLPFAIPITDPQRRLQFLLNGEQCKYILYLKVNDFVSVSGELFGKNSKRYDCIVRYIGLVQELGPGYYFGLELLHLESGYSPQAEDIPFVNIYTSCEPGLALIITADWISQLPSEVKKKFSARELLCGTFEKAKTAIGFNNNSNGNSSSSELRRSESVRKNKKSLKELSSDPQLYLKSQPDKAVASKSSHGEETGNETDQLDFAMDCNNLGINSNHTRITFDNEDYKECVKNYEKLLEQRQHENSITPPPPPPPSTPVVAILKTAKQRRLANVGDNLNTLNTSSVNNKFAGNTMSLDDRDIIVIDKADIKESTKNEANVFVVEKSRQSNEVDLADLLGGNWPNNAGDATFVLNKQADQQPAAGSSAAGQGLQGSAAAAGSNYVSSSSNSSVSSFNLQKSDRNKTSASNPLSHMARTVDRNRNRDHQWTQTSSTDSHATSENNIGGRSKEKKFKNTIEQPPLYDNVNSDVNVAGVAAVTLASPEKEFIQASPLPDVPGTSLGVGSMVEVSTDAADDLYGVIRWIGSPLGHKGVYVGVELEDDIDDKRLPTTDGSFNGIRLFKCQEGRGVFIQPSQCSKDRRFVDIDTTPGSKMSSKQPLDSKMFGHMECPPVHEDIPPLKILSLDELEEVCGKFKGIQGHHNSCYLDATLFSMFTFTSVFDSLLFRPPEPEDIPHYLEVQTVLREEIVNPLRKNVFVRADRVMKLRQLLDKLSSVSGLTSEEKDPEEFLNSLLAQIMRAEPFLKLSSGQDAFYYQLFVEKDERLSFPSVQQLFDQSFLSSDIKLKEVPSCLIIQMPRFGKNFKMYPRILPSQVLDVTDIIEDSPRQCSVCGKLAEYECRECFGILQCGVGLESTAFCRKCLETVHSHVKRANHQAKEISVPQDFKSMAEHLTVPRLFMELFAVVCIETSHYVAFVKAGSGLDAPWCFFDSMADRKGEQNGYNIPEMISVPHLPQWLSEDGARAVNETSSNDKMLPEHAKRLFCDAYMCMYQSTDVMMYR